MDWSKAKTILIVSFIFVNIILVYNLLVKNQDVDNKIDQVFIEDVVDLLNNKDIKLDTEIPREVEGLPALLVEYESINMVDINKSYFKNEGKIVNKGEGLSLLEAQDEKLTVVNGKLLIYESQKKEKIYDIKDMEEASELAIEFLTDRGYHTMDLKLSHGNIVGEEYYLQFSKVYKEKYLESAFTNVQLDNSGVKKLERLWLNVKEEAKVPIYISNAHKSILELLSINRAYEKTITDISLSYYFDPEKHEYIENPEKAKQGRAIPAWRIQFKDGYKIFLDNY